MSIHKKFCLNPSQSYSWSAIDIPSSDNADSDDDRPWKVSIERPVTGKELDLSPVIISSNDSEGTALILSLPSMSHAEPSLYALFLLLLQRNRLHQL